MPDAERAPVGIVGAGLVGAGWAIVFARAGYPVRVFDEGPAIKSFPERARNSLNDLAEFGLIDDPEAVANRLQVVGTLEEAVRGGDYV
jgi:3-hydroxyacyl-CoA dehydrogenase